jgi:hypothetical protein
MSSRQSATGPGEEEHKTLAWARMMGLGLFWADLGLSFVLFRGPSEN